MPPIISKIPPLTHGLSLQLNQCLQNIQQIEALGDVEHGFDASEGISWDSLEYAIDQITEDV